MIATVIAATLAASSPGSTVVAKEGFCETPVRLADLELGMPIGVVRAKWGEASVQHDGADRMVCYSGPEYQVTVQYGVSSAALQVARGPADAACLRITRPAPAFSDDLRLGLRKHAVRELFGPPDHEGVERWAYRCVRSRPLTPDEVADFQAGYLFEEAERVDVHRELTIEWSADTAVAIGISEETEIVHEERRP